MALTALDYEEVRQLHARYSYSIDFEDIDGLVECFAPDASFTGGGSAHTGTAELRLFGAEVSKKQIGHCRHTVLYSLIDGDGATAKSVSYATITRDYGPPQGKGQVTHASILTGGVYSDTLVKKNGNWVYATRNFFHDGHPGSLARLHQPLEIAPFDQGLHAAPAGSELTPLDHEEILQLCARYCYTLDFGDIDGLVACFTPDGVFGSLSVDDPIKGSKRLREFAINVDEKVKGHAKHACTNIVVEGDAQRARVSSYGFIPMDYGTPRQWNQRDNSTVGTTGVYHDEVVKLNGRWLFARRTFSYDGWPNAMSLVDRPLDFTPFD